MQYFFSTVNLRVGSFFFLVGQHWKILVKRLVGSEEQEKGKSVFFLSLSCWWVAVLKMKLVGREKEASNETEGRKICRRYVRKMNS